MSVLILVELQSYVPIYDFSIWQATLYLLSFKYILRVGTHIPIKTYDLDYTNCYNANLIYVPTYTEYCPT